MAGIATFIRSYVLNLPRNEMAFRADYEDLVSRQSLTTVFRPGNRVFPSWRGYKLGEIISGRIIERCGCDIQKMAPLFKGSKTPLRIAKIEVIRVAELSAEDFAGSSWDVTDLESLDLHICKIYSKPLSEYDNMVTRISLDYLEPCKQPLAASN
ncbi:MAG: hypothetical protein ACI9HX_001099 [Pseudoalteromonas tetraodonis]|jgi:hypothetical protein